MELIDGNAVASDLLEELAKKVEAFENQKPCVAFVRVGEDPASVSYVRKKEKTAAKVGIDSKKDIFAESNLLNFKSLAAEIVIPDLLTPGIKDKT